MDRSKVKDMSRPWVLQALFLMFVYLKLSDQIDWSWWQVTTPMIIAAVLGVYGALWNAVSEGVKQVKEELFDE